VGLLKELANIATQILSYLIPKNPCQPLVTTLHPNLIQNSMFTCDKHKDKICKVIIQLVMKPILNICLEKKKITQKRNPFRINSQVGRFENYKLARKVLSSCR
jgi:hypothetical protein